jgi:hypothetical protein
MKQPIGAGVFLYDVRSDRALLGLRSPKMRHYPSVWGIPGGRVESLETRLAGALRELDEEFIAYSEIEIFSGDAMHNVSEFLGEVAGQYTAVVDTPRGVWEYTTYIIPFTGDVTELSVYPRTYEHIAALWSPIADLEKLPLMKPFRDAVPMLTNLAKELT